MKIGKKLCIITVISLLFAFIFPGITHAASSGDYALMIGDEDSEYTLYEDEIVLTSTKEIMLKASSVCELLGFSYSYDKSTKKLTIKNKSNGKYLVFTNGSKEYTYYSSSKSKGSKKTAKYKCYYDSKSKSYLIHYETLNYLINCNYFYVTGSNELTELGYNHFIFISEYDELDELPVEFEDYDEEYDDEDDEDFSVEYDDEEDEDFSIEYDDEYDEDYDEDFSIEYDDEDYDEEYDDEDDDDYYEKYNDSIPTYETDKDTITFSNFLASTKYTRYVSYDILNDIKRTQEKYSDGANGLWYQIFYMMYDKDSVPSKVTCWIADNGTLAFILPNGNQYMNDGCYTVLVANNLKDKELREAFFYSYKFGQNELLAYLEQYGPANVREFIKRWKKA